MRHLPLRYPRFPQPSVCSLNSIAEALDIPYILFVPDEDIDHINKTVLNATIRFMATGRFFK